MTAPTSTERLSGAQALVRLLLAEAVHNAYGIVGGKLGPLLQALAGSPIRFTGLRHEGSGPMMAAAEFAATGRMAVALGEMGPGSLNLASGAGVAFANRLAALFITTNQHRAAAYPHLGMFMDLDTRALFAPVTKWNAVVSDARRLPGLVRTAFREALSGRPGPVHLDIPQDVLGQLVDWPAGTFDIAPARSRALHRPRPAAAAVDDAVALLRGARRPLIVAGGGVVTADAVPALRQLAARLGAPVVPTQMALGTVPTDSPHFIGHGGIIAGAPVRQAFEAADVVLAVGCRFSSWVWDADGALARPAHALVNINIDPSALGSPALHAVAMHADAKAALDDLQAALGDFTPATDSGWLPSLRAARAAHVAQLATMAADTSLPLHPAALATELGQALPDDALVVYDGGHTTFWSNDLTPVQAPRTRFHEPGMSHLGFGLPYALALQGLHPGRPVVLVTGDGSFGFTMQELDTARRQRLPVVVVIHNNASWGIIREGQRKADFELGTALDGTDYAAIARGFGCHGAVVERPGELAHALQQALASGLPAVIDARVRFVPHPATPAFGSMNRYGFGAG